MATDARPDFKHAYAYDYDNDGGYARSDVFVDLTAPKTPTQTKYAYKHDRDNDGSYARKRVPVEKTSTVVTTEVIAIPFAIDENLQRRCTLAKPTFFFEFDSAKLPEDTETDFNNIVDCLQHASLADNVIEVIGHADARGDSDYNRQLGRERAETVAGELREAGLSAERIAVVSKGERKADDPDHWDDRRVVIRLK